MKPDQQYGPVGNRILFENDLVRVWEISLEPGDHLPLHSHALPYLVVTIAHGMRTEKHLSSKLARDLSSLHSWFLDERELLHRHQQASDVTKMTCEAAPHSTACLLKSRCATRGKCGGCWKSPSPYPCGLLNCG